jgi:FkbM family methyltransferase
MPEMFYGLLKPEYRAHPSQLFRRLWRGLRASPPTVCVSLPWGNELEITPKEVIGRQIYHMGVFDLSVTELLWRLTETGSMTFDVGANIGYTSSILARGVGPKGRVHAFEPHPVVAPKFRANAKRWTTPPNGEVMLHELALGRSQGTIDLCMPVDFRENEGLASICSYRGGAGSVPVVLTTLDAMVDTLGVPSLIKIDVEGAEEEVLEGSRRALARRLIRDIVFEDEGPMPTASHRILTDYGYAIFSLRASDAGPVVTPVGEPAPSLRLWDSPSYLATLDVARMRTRLQRSGWTCLRGV